MFKPFWHKVNEFIRFNPNTKTKSYSKMKTNQIKKRRTANKLARKNRRINSLNISPGRCKRRFL